MQQLIERIRRDATYLGDGIVKVDSFLNHQVDSGLLSLIGESFAGSFPAQITRVITAEVSGIPPALCTAQAVGVPMVFARKHASAIVRDGDDYFHAEVVSRTKAEKVTLRLAKAYLKPTDHVLIIDDFLATGSTLQGLEDIVSQSGATLAGVGCVVEKPVEHGRLRLAHLECPIVSFAKVHFAAGEVIVNG